MLVSEAKGNDWRVVVYFYSFIFCDMSCSAGHLHDVDY